MTQSTHVTFGNIDVRVYDRTVSDNPSVTIGVPVGLDWTFEDVESYASVDDYERARLRKYRLKLSHYERLEILEKSGLTKQEIKAVEKKVKRSKLQRKMSLLSWILANIMLAPFESFKYEAIQMKKRKFIREYRRDNQNFQSQK